MKDQIRMKDQLRKSVAHLGGEQNAKFDEEIEKIGNSITQSGKNVDDFWLKF